MRHLRLLPFVVLLLLPATAGAQTEPQPLPGLPGALAVSPGFGGPHVLSAHAGSRTSLRADLTGDGVPDRVVVQESAGEHPVVHVTDGRTHETRTIHPFAHRSGGAGATIAVGDVDGHPGAELIVGAGPGAAPRVDVFRFSAHDAAAMSSYDAFSPEFRGGVSVAVADLDGDGVDEIITGAGPGGGPNVRVFDGRGTLLADFFAFDPGYRGGVHVG